MSTPLFHLGTLIGLTQVEATALFQQGISSPEDMTVWTQDDFNATLPSSNITIKRKLAKMADYFAKGGKLDEHTKWEDVMNFDPTSSEKKPAAVRETYRLDNSASSSKITVNPIKPFGGNPIDWEDWEVDFEAAIGQTMYAALLRNAPDPDDLTGMARNKGFFNMQKRALKDGSAFHIVEKIENEDGHELWRKIKEWYSSEETSQVVVAHYTARLERLKLNENTDATTYINNFNLCCRKLESRNEVRLRESNLHVEEALDPATKARRVAAKESRESTSGKQVPASTSSNSNKKYDIPFFPTFLLKRIEQPEVRKALLKWRSLYVHEGRAIRPDEVDQPGGNKSPSDDKSGDDTTRTSEKSGSKKRKRNKVRRTNIVSSGTTNPIVLLKDAKEREQVPDDSEDDIDGPARPPKKKPKRKHAVKSRRVTEPGSGAARNGRIILDSGTEAEIIGGVGWKILETIADGTRGVTVTGAIEGGGETTLPLVNAICAFDSPNGTILLGLGNAAYDSRESQSESLVNTHIMRSFGIQVHDTLLEHGGEQCLKVDGKTIPLNVTHNNKILYLPIRKPSDHECTTMPIHWLSPRLPIGAPELLKYSSRRQKVQVSEEKVDWLANMGYPPPETMARTLAATTQLCVSEQSENPEGEWRQHRMMRLIPLHPRRLPGRADSDTFYSPIKSTRGFTCVQIFVHLASQFLFVRPLRRESHSYQALQDFIRYVGAPTSLLTDNAKTQTGSKWATTCRRHVIKQIFSVPHNQQQNHSERKIQDVKRRIKVNLRRSGAPLTFWCYCLDFVVTSLNHTARRNLEWRTPQEIYDGHTPDISLFRFAFWAPISYYEPTAKFPASNFRPGRFIGFALDHGDAFTYHIWTEPNDEWQLGQELIRNIVRPRIATDKLTVDTTLAGWDLVAEGPQARKRRRQSPPPEIQSRSPNSIGEESMDSEEVGGQDDEPDQAPLPTTEQTLFQNASENSSDEDTTDSEVETATTGEINQSLEAHAKNDPQPRITKIEQHQWKQGQLELVVLWSTGDRTTERLRDLREDYPRMLAQYLVAHNVTRKTHGLDRNLQWAHHLLRQHRRSVRRVARLYDFILDENDEVKMIRRAAKKKKRYNPAPIFKYGVQVPRNPKEALELDKRNGNTFWQDAIEKEMSALDKMKVFEYKDSDYQPGPDYQKTTIHIIFDVKQDLRRKARAVAGGHLIEAIDVNIYSSTVKGISVKLVQVIAHQCNLKLLCGDVSNAYVNAYTQEKVYIKAGAEFGEKQGKIVIIRKALYGLVSSSERWHSHFADTLRGLGFVPTRYDADVWIRLASNNSHYEYICTHVDDFIIASQNPERIMEEIKAIYEVKNEGPPDYYLGNDYKTGKEGRWYVGCKKYLTEAIKRVESMFGILNKKTTPITPGDHPELDTSELLSDDEHRKFQMLIGMANWLVTIGRLDIAYATMSLSRFTATPRKGHLERALHLFGYLKRRPNRRYVIDSRSPIFLHCEDAFNQDLRKELGEAYPDAGEEVDCNLPAPLLDELAITAFVDSDHAHDKVTRRSVTGILIFVGRTPVFYSSKRQGAIETSTYGAEFMAMKTAVEEIIAVRYMLRGLGVNVTTPTPLFGDNLGVIQNTTIKESLLKKKHVAIAYHKAREATAAGIVMPIHLSGENNYSDILTKAVTVKVFSKLVGEVLHG